MLLKCRNRQVNIQKKTDETCEKHELGRWFGHALEKPPESSVRKLGGEATSLELIDCHRQWCGDAGDLWTSLANDPRIGKGSLLAHLFMMGLCWFDIFFGWLMSLFSNWLVVFHDFPSLLHIDLLNNLEATFPYSENLRIPCFHRTPDLGFGMLLW